LSVAQKKSKIGVPFNETGYQSVHKICGPFTVKTRLDKNEEYDPPAMNQGVVANLKGGGEAREGEVKLMYVRKNSLICTCVSLLPPPPPTLYCFAPDF
jgi:hypothetical protein